MLGGYLTTTGTKSPKGDRYGAADQDGSRVCARLFPPGKTGVALEVARGARAKGERQFARDYANERKRCCLTGYFKILAIYTVKRGQATMSSPRTKPRVKSGNIDADMVWRNSRIATAGTTKIKGRVKGER